MMSYSAYTEYCDTTPDWLGVIPSHWQKMPLKRKFRIVNGSTPQVPDSLVDQLEASEAWCRALHSIIKHYTREARRVHLTKYVLSCHTNPGPYLDRTGKYLQRDHSIRHYHYQDVDGLSLDALDNTNVEVIN